MQPPFETPGSGWGSFTINVLIALRSGYYWVHPEAAVGPGNQSLLPLEWTLSFEREFSYTEVEVQVGESEIL